MIRSYSQQVYGRQIAPQPHSHGQPRENPCGCGGGGSYGGNGAACGPGCGGASPATPLRDISLQNRGATVSAQGCLDIQSIQIQCNACIDTCLPPVLVFCEAERIFTADSFDGRVFVFDTTVTPCPNFEPRDAGCTPGSGSPLVAIDNPAKDVTNQPSVIFVVNSRGKFLQWDRVGEEFDEIDAPLKAYCSDFRPVMIGNPTAIFTDLGGAAQFLVPRRCSRNTMLDPSNEIEDTDKTEDFCPPLGV